jgi:hypothetical protein
MYVMCNRLQLYIQPYVIQNRKINQGNAASVPPEKYRIILFFQIIVSIYIRKTAELCEIGPTEACKSHSARFPPPLKKSCLDVLDHL